MAEDKITIDQFVNITRIQKACKQATDILTWCHRQPLLRDGAMATIVIWAVRVYFNHQVKQATRGRR